MGDGLFLVGLGVLRDRATQRAAEARSDGGGIVACPSIIRRRRPDREGPGDYGGAGRVPVDFAGGRLLGDVEPAVGGGNLLRVGRLHVPERLRGE